MSDPLPGRRFLVWSQMLLAFIVGFAIVWLCWPARNRHFVAVPPALPAETVVATSMTHDELHVAVARYDCRLNFHYQGNHEQVGHGWFNDPKVTALGMDALSIRSPEPRAFNGNGGSLGPGHAQANARRRAGMLRQGAFERI